MAPKQKDPPTIVAYHGNCMDGAAAAWTIAKHLGVKNPGSHDDNITYVPYEHHQRSVAETQIRKALTSSGSAADIYFADIAPERAFLEEVLPLARNVHILDHHSSSDMLQDFRGVPNLRVHINPVAPSAAKMIWDFYFPGKEPPPVINLINLMDGSSAGLRTPRDFAAAAFVDSKDIRTTDAALDTLRGLATLAFNDMARGGTHIVADQTARIDELLRNAKTVKMQILPDASPVNVPIVYGDICHHGRQISQRLVDLGKQDHGPGVGFMWLARENGTVSMSIRSDGRTDARAIVNHLRKAIGPGATGGGHKDNAAIHMPLAVFAKHVPIDQLPVLNQTPSEKPALVQQTAQHAHFHGPE